MATNKSKKRAKDEKEEEDESTGNRGGIPIVAIQWIAGQNVENTGVTPVISPPPPWPVSGTVTHNINNPVGAMGYQVDGGRVNSFPVPPGAGNPQCVTAVTFSFNLTAADIMTSGLRMLTVYAWAVDNSLGMDHRNVQATNINPTPLPPSP